jgi:hypothetical protein
LIGVVAGRLPGVFDTELTKKAKLTKRSARPEGTLLEKLALVILALRREALLRKTDVRVRNPYRPPDLK